MPRAVCNSLRSAGSASVAASRVIRRRPTPALPSSGAPRVGRRLPCSARGKQDRVWRSLWRSGSGWATRLDWRRGEHPGRRTRGDRNRRIAARDQVTGPRLTGPWRRRPLWLVTSI